MPAKKGRGGAAKKTTTKKEAPKKEAPKRGANTGKKRGGKKSTGPRQTTIFESFSLPTPKKKQGRPKGSSNGVRTLHASQPLIKIICDCKKP